LAAGLTTRTATAWTTGARIFVELEEPTESQLVIIEQALENASLMLGSDKSRGYFLETICADLLAGANLQEGNPDTLVLAVRRLVEMLPTGQNLQVHHINARSHLGDASEQNLITLCSNCHRLAHQKQ
jgi:hypothetical protein